MAYLNRLLYSPFFQNKFVLYGSLLLVLLSILRHIANRKFNGVILMALIGLLMSYFSKNMIIVLLTAFVSVFVLEMIGVQGAIEGMENKGDSDEKKEEHKEGDDKDKEHKAGDDKEKEHKAGDEKDQEHKETKPSSEGKKEGNTGQAVVNTHKETEKKHKQGMTKLSPASYDGKEHDDSSSGSSGSSGNRIDYASTLEQAYDNIENIIGEDGVRGLTDQTKSLMNQQKQLMENMKDMGPLLKSAEGFMKQITGNGGIGGITEMLKGFATPGGK